MGSVKDLKIIKKPTAEESGIGRFTFSDRYSVFDWGEMPDLIPNKGQAIAILGAYFFEKLEKIGIPTHYIGLVDNTVKKLNMLDKPVDTMEFKLLRVIKPKLVNNQYDYSIYRNAGRQGPLTLPVRGNFLLPLEIIYRNCLPPGSSVFKRLKNNEIKPEDLGLKKMPLPNQKLLLPIIDVSTKLEITDRYLKWAEAQQISCLTDNEIKELKILTGTVNKFITDEFAKIGLVNEDGKIEVGFDVARGFSLANQERHFILVDVLGTLDECRFTFDGLPVSKEIARIYYRKTPWYQAVEEAKQKNRQFWKKICKLAPEPLPSGLKLLISQVYCACTNEITGNKWFNNIPSLREILKEIKLLLNL